ncbi:4-carboxy-4-hydroxy-2-oxoadipate aldolase/oxaloacetate decarboxylase [Alicyclobacillus fastidiosus]|uniref:Putative 4-hydroxy-4-methyl-2-oxoglutarate aldolase n=1 Tax=Alicyclobacillus fastidiosus TaxID=392011 RepID=A0ABY6ZEK0_9BACL|nr:4-carboxy-4-hydroxy-2-oxoadipate aldolase/oxaloacetate decarboxylase [Alicyclobacillus fastidiosus]WAH41281.1 4-carboxy-4-hydroxy-2-oxoadipate aldolase/oxaloacetate decarboxylase [Alicyclobacillus fastidiosus]GMA62878.1 4-carboxy-4-hydroxy-2-oxoadipate aldolase/oxaloacetate decarboxylase [Alicyclobacillus fastidiosus]
MMHKIVKNISRPNQEDIAKLGELGAATVHEAMGRTGLLKPYLRPVDAKMKVCGTAVTVSCHPGDNLMIHAAIEVCQPGDVLVVTVTSDNTDGMFGELLAVSARAHGVRGLIIDAGVRDTVEITEMNFPVFAKAVSAKGTVKATPGSVNVPVVCAGTLINPGDVIIGDADGVVCVPKEQVSEAIAQGQARIERENKTKARLAAGELGLDIYNLRPKLEALGVVYVEE